jgi:sugar transferase (PEP-CTERM/EpsH1 system associated)
MSHRRVVAHVVHSLATGGLENGVVNLVNGTGSSFRHVIVCLTTDGPLRQRVSADVAVFTVGKRPGHDWRAFLRLVGLLRHIRPDVVHSRNWAGVDAVPAALLAGVRVRVHGEHGREIVDPDGRNAVRNRARRLLAPVVSRFVAVSRDLRRWLVEDVGVPAAKVTTIQNGVDLGRFSRGSRSEARAALGVRDDALVVGTVGRLDPVKDQSGLIRAFGEALRAHPGALLLVAGDGPCREELAGVVRSLSLEQHVRLLGERQDIPDVLAALDVFVLPSIAEGMSNTVLEAMASGLPVVATRVGGNPEMVEDGVSGRLVAARDHGALTTAICGYLRDPHLRRLHGNASRERVLRDFSLTRMNGEYDHLYQHLLLRRFKETL